MLLALYFGIIAAYVAILYKMTRMFKSAFPDNYKVIRCKFFVIFWIYESFLSCRAACYYILLFNQRVSEDDTILVIDWNTFYISEIMLITFLSYISLKSNEDAKKPVKG